MHLGANVEDVVHGVAIERRGEIDRIVDEHAPRQHAARVTRI